VAGLAAAFGSGAMTNSIPETIVYEIQNVGNHDLNWHVGQYPSGIYLCKLVIGDAVYNKKVLIIR